MSEGALYTIAGLVGAAVLTALLMLVLRRKHGDQWVGTVVEIQPFTKTDQEGDDLDYVRIACRLTDGSERTLNLREYDFQLRYPALHIGERLIKAPGEMLPARVPPNQA